MTDWKLLDEKIAESGIRKGYLYQKVGISRAAWCKRKALNIEFKPSEIQIICEVLNIKKLSEQHQIFFAQK